MLRKISIVLWCLVLVAGAWWVYNRQAQKRVDPSDRGHDGRAFQVVSWKRLPGIPAFTMTDQQGEKFNSASLAGEPYVVSFFFSTCPTICRDLNRQIKRLNDQFLDTGLTFLSITVDPETDTPQVLNAYANEFDADAESWRFLTGQMFRVREIGEQYFGGIVDQQTHTDDILLVDRWGRYRDRFAWDDPREMKRFAAVVRQVLKESEPPLDESVRTRNVLAGVPHHQLPKVPFLFDFHLTDQDNQPFFSRDLTGQVWVASFFFTSCPGICPKQNQYLVSIQNRLADRDVKLVSISTDPQTDVPTQLRQYARQMGAGNHWTFLTGSKNYIRRVGSEFLGLAGDGEHHSSWLAVIDRWGNVRARIDWQLADSTRRLLDLVEQLNQENKPPATFEVINPETQPPS